MQSVLNCLIYILERKQDSVFGIVTKQRMGQPRIRVSVPDKERILMFSGSGLHLACY